MHRGMSLRFGVFCLVLVGSSVQEPPKSQHNVVPTREKTHGIKRYCDPSFNNQTQCHSGFYREWTGPHRGQCRPCRCNGLSNECDGRTGKCANCLFNTAGDHCERCEEGYYGNAANRTCRACPCPLTSNNFALACLDIGSGVVECLCKRGYSGSRCERCSYGYYGNPLEHGGSCRLCKWGEGNLNGCDLQAGGCDGCTYALLMELEKIDDGLTLLKQQLQNVTYVSGFHTTLNNLTTHISKTKVLIGSYSSAVTKLNSKSEQLETDASVITDDLDKLFDRTLLSKVNVEKFLRIVNGTKSKADDLLSAAALLLTAVQTLMKQLSEVNPAGSIAVSENHKVRMMEEAQSLVQEMRNGSCSAQRDRASTEQQEARKLLNFILNNEGVPLRMIQAAESMRGLAVLLSEAEDRVRRTQDLNLKSQAALQHLQMKIEENTVFPVTPLTKNLLKNISIILLLLQEDKREHESQAAQLDGAKGRLLEKLSNSMEIEKKMEILNNAEDHAAQLSTSAASLQQELSKFSNSNDPLTFLHKGAHVSITDAIKDAELAANQSRQAPDQAMKDVDGRNLTARAAGMKENSFKIQTAASDTQSDFKALTHTLNHHRDRIKEREEKAQSLRTGLSSVSDDLTEITGDSFRLLKESADLAASESNATLAAVARRLSDISHKVEKITLTNVTVKVDRVLTDTEQTMTDLETVLPALTKKLKQVESFKRKMPPSANMTESIRRIKDVIEETRNFVNRLSIAMTFNGKGHIQLHPPKNLEDIKSFTLIDLLLNRHQRNLSESHRGRKRRQDTLRDSNQFILYLGDKDLSGDYVGMAVRNNVLICVYKLGDVVHTVETSEITTTSHVNLSDLDRVVFHRVYQDAEVEITQNFTSAEPVRLPTKQHLPNNVARVLNLVKDRVVLYVGGYPDDFTPPAQLRYSGYRGSMKLSYINDRPFCLFNYKHAVDMDTRQPYIKIPNSEVSDYYDGTGYRMASVKEPEKKKRRLFKFHTNSRETDALLFYIGNEESFFCVFVERGFLVVKGQQGGRELRAQSEDKISLSETAFAINTAERFVVRYGGRLISIDYVHTNFSRFYVGGLPAHLRLRQNITAPPLRGCVHHLTVDGEVAEYDRTLGVSDGCPVSSLVVRTATTHSALPIDSLLVWEDHTVTVSVGFRTTDRYGTLLSSSSQSSTFAFDLQLSLDDGYVIFNSNNYSLKSNDRYSDGEWHYLSAVRTLKGLELIVDNVNVSQVESHYFRPAGQNSRGRKFKACITNLYIKRPKQSFTPVDLSSLSLSGDVVLGSCHLTSTSHIPPVLKKHHKRVQTPADSECSRHRQAHRGEHWLFDEHSWVSYTLPQQDLNYRPHFSLNVKTKSPKGLILHVAGRGAVSLLALYLANGKIKMSLGTDRIIQHHEKSNDGNWHRVELSVENTTFHLLVDGVRVTDGHLPNNEGSSLELHNPVFIGSDLKSRNTKGNNIPMHSIIGCIRDLKMNEITFGRPDKSHKTLPCFNEQTDVGSYFGGGYIILDNDIGVAHDFVWSVELRPEHLTGLLFHAESDNVRINVYIKDNKVGFKVNIGNRAVNLSATPPKSLCDGKFHTISVTKQKDIFRLEVDAVSEEKHFFTPVSESTTAKSLYIGGMTRYSHVPVSSPFLGCIRKVKINGRTVDFDKECTVVGPVGQSQCPKE